MRRSAAGAREAASPEPVAVGSEGGSALVRDGGAAIWRQIEQTLAREIVTGQLSARLPNETQLAERFGVNRHTVRQAAKALAERGLVEVVHGRGTFVREEVIDYELGPRTRFAHSLDKASRLGHSQIVGSGEMPATAEVAEALRLPAGHPVLRVNSLDCVTELGQPRVVGLCTQYFPLPRFTGLVDLYQQCGTTHLALARLGVSGLQRLSSRISADLPRRDEAKALGIPVRQPLLQIESVYADAVKTPVEFGITRFNSLAVQLLVNPG